MENKANSNRQKIIRGYGALVMAVIFLSISPIMIRVADAPGIITTFYRMSIAALFFTPFFIRSETRGKAVPLAGKERWFLLLPIIAGTSSACDHILWSVALGKTSVSNTAVLNSVAPLWITFLALFFLKEKFRSRFWIGLALVLGGIFSMSGKGLDLFSEGFSEGDAIALFSSMFYAGYFLFTQLGRGHFSAIRQMWMSLTACSVVVGITALVQGLSFTGYDTNTWLCFLAAAFLCQVGGYFCMTYALGSLSASVVSPSIEVHSVASSLIAVPVLGEAFMPNQIIGCIAVLSGIFLINQSKLSDQ